MGEWEWEGVNVRDVGGRGVGGRVRMGGCAEERVCRGAGEHGWCGDEPARLCSWFCQVTETERVEPAGSSVRREKDHVGCACDGGGGGGGTVALRRMETNCWFRSSRCEESIRPSGFSKASAPSNVWPENMKMRGVCSSSVLRASSSVAAGSSAR